MVFTVFRQGSCRTSERKCANGHCIAHAIVCNNHNPCGDGSDCRTGLEHLSSWAMSGIVILALLSGGILIIMVTVCLQKSGQKRDNWDDLSTAVNGVYKQDTHVELVDVADASDVKHIPQYSRKTRNESRKTHTPEKRHVYHESSQHNSESSQCFIDNANLIQTNTLSSSPIMCSVGLAETDSDVSIELFSSDGKKSDRSGTITTSVSSYNMDEAITDNANQILLKSKVVENNINRSNSDLFIFSEAGLVLTDSDSGQDDDNMDKFAPKTTTFKALTTSLTEKRNYEANTSDILPNQSPYFQTPSHNLVAKHKYKNGFKIPSNDFTISQ